MAWSDVLGSFYADKLQRLSTFCRSACAGSPRWEGESIGFDMKADKGGGNGLRELCPWQSATRFGHNVCIERCLVVFHQRLHYLCESKTILSNITWHDISRDLNKVFWVRLRSRLNFCWKRLFPAARYVNYTRALLVRHQGNITTGAGVHSGIGVRVCSPQRS